jgi:cytosine/uracil/thiamine/allantoin permease
MSEQYIKAEIVRPKRPAPEVFGLFVGTLLWLAVVVLIVWWFFAAWFPQLGLTYWQLVLPVYAYRVLNGRMPIGRALK